MKLSYLIEQYLDEISPPSEASKEAKDRGLSYAGYGKWKDASGQTVAKTVQGKLVKMEPGEEDSAPAQPKQNAPQKALRPAAATMVAPEVDVPDSYISEPETEPEPMEPQADNVIDRLVNSANGDYMKVRKVLVKKLRDGKTGAKELLDRLDVHEKTEHDRMMAGVAAVQARKDAELASRKSKYASLYPSPNI